MGAKKSQPFKTAQPSKKTKQVTKTKHVGESVAYAFEGFAHILFSERNFQIHLFISVVVIAVAWFFKISLTEWAIIVLTIGGMLALETVNTALEHLVDLSQQGEYHPVAKKAKDISAAACLVFAVIAVIVGSLVFLPKVVPF